jgi:hypothetical protein
MNSWLWQSYEEFESCVQPTETAMEPMMWTALEATTHVNLQGFFSALGDLYEAMSESNQLVGQNGSRISKDKPQISQIVECIYTFVREGESLLLYCRPLAMTDAGRSFVLRKEVVNHVARYVEECRIGFECAKLAKAVGEMLDEYERFIKGYHELLINGLTLPAELRAEFVCARNLLSTGFDEAGLIYAGRGLEGTVRRIARDHQIMLKSGKPAAEARFAEALQRLQELRFAATQELLLAPPDVMRLQYARTMRNHVAHPAAGAGQARFREEAIIMAAKAQDLWTRCSAPGVKLV